MLMLPSAWLLRASFPDAEFTADSFGADKVIIPQTDNQRKQRCNAGARRLLRRASSVTLRR